MESKSVCVCVRERETYVSADKCNKVKQQSTWMDMLLNPSVKYVFTTWQGASTQSSCVSTRLSYTSRDSLSEGLLCELMWSAVQASALSKPVIYTGQLVLVR